MPSSNVPGDDRPDAVSCIYNIFVLDPSNFHRMGVGCEFNAAASRAARFFSSFHLLPSYNSSKTMFDSTGRQLNHQKWCNDSDNTHCISNNNTWTQRFYYNKYFPFSASFSLSFSALFLTYMFYCTRFSSFFFFKFFYDRNYSHRYIRTIYMQTDGTWMNYLFSTPNNSSCTSQFDQKMWKICWSRNGNNFFWTNRAMYASGWTAFWIKISCVYRSLVDPFRIWILSCNWQIFSQFDCIFWAGSSEQSWSSDQAHRWLMRCVYM